VPLLAVLKQLMGMVFKPATLLAKYPLTLLLLKLPKARSAIKRVFDKPSGISETRVAFREKAPRLLVLEGLFKIESPTEAA